MKFLIDAGLSRLVVEAGQDNRILVSADTDFGTMLALRGDRQPSLLLLRRWASRVPERQLAFLLTNLAALEASLERGSVVVIDGTRATASNRRGELNSPAHLWFVRGLETHAGLGWNLSGGRELQRTGLRSMRRNGHGLAHSPELT